MPLRRRLLWGWLALGLAMSASPGPLARADTPVQAPSAPTTTPSTSKPSNGTATRERSAPNTAASSNTAAPGGSTSPQDWNQPFEPFRIVGNIYYVGARGVSAFFIHTPAGAILLDGGLVETAPQIEKNIGALGFRLQDVKLLLNSHAHFDHAGGLAALQKASGAKLVASQGDAVALRAGSAQQPAVRVDRVVADGDTVELGGTRLTAHVTPGHTRGCTTWTMAVEDAGKSHPVVFYCSTSVVDRLVNNPSYPSIVADYERSFAALRALPCDVFLGPHGDFFQLGAKRDAQKSGGANPFIDPGELHRYIERSERSFREALAKERAEPPPAGPSPRS